MHGESVQERNRRQTREAIIDAARELLKRDRWGVSMADVAVEAGVSLRTLYRYFATREALLVAAGGAVGADFAPELGAPRSPRELQYRLPRALAALEPPGDQRDADAQAARQRRHEVVATALLPLLRQLAPRDRRLVLNAALVLCSGEVFAASCRELALPPQESAEVFAWMLGRTLAGFEGA